jgi:hypothetical protein
MLVKRFKNILLVASETRGEAATLMRPAALARRNRARSVARKRPPTASQLEIGDE